MIPRKSGWDDYISVVEGTGDVGPPSWRSIYHASIGIMHLCSLGDSSGCEDPWRRLV